MWLTPEIEYADDDYKDDWQPWWGREHSIYDVKLKRLLIDLRYETLVQHRVINWSDMSLIVVCQMYMDEALCTLPIIKCIDRVSVWVRREMGINFKSIYSLHIQVENVTGGVAN